MNSEMAHMKGLIKKQGQGAKTMRLELAKMGELLEQCEIKEPMTDKLKIKMKDKCSRKEPFSKSTQQHSKDSVLKFTSWLKGKSKHGQGYRNFEIQIGPLDR